MIRYTKQMLENMSDLELILSLISERKSSTTNPYSPLNQRLNALANKINNGEITITVKEPAPENDE